MTRAQAQAATRSNLVRARRRMDRVEKGVMLLRRKREALVTELFRLARPAMDARAVIARRAQQGYEALLAGLAIHGRTGLEAMAWPTRDLQITLRAGSVWGIPVAEIVEKPTLRRSLAARGTAPGTTGPAAAEMAARFEELADLLLQAAPHEILIRRLGDALSKTTRQVNTLEQRVEPALGRQIAVVRRVLEEREREEHGRLRHLLRKRRAVSFSA